MAPPPGLPITINAGCIPPMGPRMGSPILVERTITMSKTTLDTQAVVELPAREMLGFNFTKIVLNQGNANYQFGVLNIQAGQANYAEILVVND
jgi:hypothetical protein